MRPERPGSHAKSSLRYEIGLNSLCGNTRGRACASSYTQVFFFFVIKV